MEIALVFVVGIGLLLWWALRQSAHDQPDRPPGRRPAGDVHWSPDPYNGEPARCGATANLTIDGSKVTCPTCRAAGREALNAADDFAEPSIDVDVQVRRTEAGGPPGRDIAVAGTSYRQDDLRALMAKIGDRSVQAALMREPGNPHDPDAVAVYVSRKTGTRRRKAASLDGVHVGYWPRLEPCPSVPDSGLLVRAKLVGGDDGKNVGCRIYRDSVP